MNKSVSTLLLTLVSVAAAGNALAQSVATDASSQTRVIQVAVPNPVPPIMSHEVATIIKLTHQAEAQYRRTGNPQDLARVKAMRLELASHGFGRVTRPAPAVDPNLAQFAQ